MIKTLKAFAVTTVSTIALLSGAAYADTVTETATDAAVDNSVGDIVITAQRREEKLQDVPLAVTALPAAKLLDSELLTASDISRLVPNFEGAGTSTRISRPRYFLRGIGVNDPSSNVTSPIGIYVDDVYLGDTAYETFPLFDEERIEVLRGPQGTLYGKNTIGGAINFISKAPTFDTNGYVKVDFGNNGSKSTQGGFGGALIKDKLAGRISFDYEDIGGYTTNTYTGQAIGTDLDEALRVQLLATPTDDLSITLNGHVRNLQERAGPGYRIGTFPGGADAYGYIPPYKTSPVLGDPISNDAYTPPSTLKTAGGLVNLKYDLGEYTLTSISAYDQQANEATGDGDNSPLPESLSHSAVSSHQLSEELRIASPASDRFNWQGGLHYFTETFNSATASATTAATVGTLSRRNAYSFTTFRQYTESYAAFADATYHITDDLSVEGGIRWTTERKAIALIAGGSAQGTATFANTSQFWLPGAVTSPITTNASERHDIVWSKPTFSISPEYAISDNLRAYLRYASGFRSGGYNGNVSSQVAASVVEPETLDDYEAGIKSEWFDHKLIANLSAFYYNYSNIQVNIQGTLAGTTQSGTTLRNAANGIIDGVELELTAVPIDNLRVTFNPGYLFQANYTDFKTVVVTNGVSVPTDASGNYIARAPKLTATIDVEYTLPLPAIGGDITIGTDWSYRSHIFFNAVTQNDHLQEQGGYAIGNAHLSYRTEDDVINVTAYTTNIANRQYLSSSIIALPTGYARIGLGNPRTFGVSLTGKF